MNTTQCEQCERQGRVYDEETTSYGNDSGCVETYHNEVVRCGYHSRNTNYVNYTRVSN